MHHIKKEILLLFPRAEFGAPCNEREIAEAGAELGKPLPREIGLLYSHFNGIFVPGSSEKLFPLLRKHGNTSLVSITQFLRQEPWARGIDDVVFFGMSRQNMYWGADNKPSPQVVEFSHEIEAPRVVAKSIMEAYRMDQAWNR